VPSRLLVRDLILAEEIVDPIVEEVDLVVLPRGRSATAQDLIGRVADFTHGGEAKPDLVPAQDRDRSVWRFLRVSMVSPWLTSGEGAAEGVIRFAQYRCCRSAAVMARP
jgi:hypothetical protein